jgi:hypothetical protein
MDHIFDTHDKILEVTPIYIVISLTIYAETFQWNSVSPDTEDLLVGWGELGRKLLLYSMHGLEIKDDDGKMMKAFLLQYTNNMYLISRFSQVAFCSAPESYTKIDLRSSSVDATLLLPFDHFALILSLTRR